MKVNRYFPKNFIKLLLSATIIFSATSYFMNLIFKFDLPISIVCNSILIIGSVLIFNRRIILYEDRVIIIQMYKKIEIKFECIMSLNIQKYTPEMSNMSTDVICATLKHDMHEIFYYKPYERESIIEIINYAYRKNNNIKIDSNIEVLIGNKVSEYDLSQRTEIKKEQIILAVFIIGMVIKMIYKYMIL